MASVHNVYFVDTSCWVAILNNRDFLHHDVSDKFNELVSGGSRFVTTNFVITETANMFSVSTSRKTMAEFYRRIKSSKVMTIMHVDENLWKTGWTLFESRQDKDWSLTDCISMVCMRKKKINDALTADVHFNQAGFNAVFSKLKK
jgi:predicted nucleic acid-binding protein